MKNDAQDFYRGAFHCHVCGDHEFGVRWRQNGEDIASWIELVKVAVGATHLARSPKCPSTECDLKLPMPAGSPFLGGRPVN